MTAPDAKPNPLHADHPALILARGGLHSTNHTPNDALPFRTLHNVDIQNVRRARPGPCCPGGAMHDYVPFYFGQLSPMLLRSKSWSGTTPQATATARSRMSKSSFSRVPPMKPRLSSPVTLTRISASTGLAGTPDASQQLDGKGSANQIVIFSIGSHSAVGIPCADNFIRTKNLPLRGPKPGSEVWANRHT